jgi:hypothetical protein
MNSGLRAPSPAFPAAPSTTKSRDNDLRTNPGALRHGRLGARKPESFVGRHVSGIYRQCVELSSGRFAMIDKGLGFQFVPWRPPLKRQFRRQIAGVMMAGGRIEWNF